jgi:hypothetical protein
MKKQFYIVKKVGNFYYYWNNFDARWEGLLDNASFYDSGLNATRAASRLQGKITVSAY